MPKFKVFHHIDQQTIDAMYRDYRPVFILSCGRSGSRFIHSLLARSASVQSYHEAFPNLMYFSDYAFHHQDKPEVLKMMIQASRMELILTAFNENKIYVESNQCLSFFAPALNDLFPKSRFIHLIRHPADFVRSAIRKGWHLNDSIWESGRLKMRASEWEGMSRIQKLAWLWAETNHYLAGVLSVLPPERVKFLKTEDLFGDLKSVRAVYGFCGVDVPIPDSALDDLMKTPVNELMIDPDEPLNMRKVWDFPSYDAWTPAMKDELKQYAVFSAERYGYDL